MRRFWLAFVNTVCIFMWEETRSRRQMRKIHKRGYLDGSVAKAQKRHTEWCVSFVVGEDGFEPSKRYAADLQSVPFGHSGTPPYEVTVCWSR